MFRTAALALTFCSASATAAAEGTPLWRDLKVGDTPEIVVQKLSAVPGVKRAKVKGPASASKPSMDINYQEGGVQISGIPFKIIPTFENRTLRQVGLASEALCTNDGFGRAASIITILRQKYPRLADGSPEIGERDYMAAKFRAEAVKPAHLAMGLSNGEAVAVFVQRFTRIDPPPNGYESGALARAARDFLWQQYDSAARDCNGTGRYRVNFVVTYLPAEDYKSLVDGAAKKLNDDASDAASKL